MTLEGKLFLFSETGTEGGYWAFQDKNYMSLVTPNFGVSADTRVWDINNKNRTGVALSAEVLINQIWLTLPDPMTKDPDYLISSIYRGEDIGDNQADQRLMTKYNFRIKYAAERLDEMYGKDNWKMKGSLSNIILKDGSLLSFGTSPTTEPNRPYGIPQNALTRATVKWSDGETEHERKSDTLLVRQWDYKGLHILKNGDKLKIIHPIDNSTVWEGIINLKEFNLFSEHARGMWIHHDQIGITREQWTDYFFNDYSAELDKIE